MFLERLKSILGVQPGDIGDATLSAARGAGSGLLAGMTATGLPPVVGNLSADITAQRLGTGMDAGAVLGVAPAAGRAGPSRATP